MKENALSLYVRLTTVNAPIPSNTTNTRGEPLYHIKAVGISNCGAQRNANSGNFETERREVDLLFAGLTSQHAAVLCQDCEVLINGASVFSHEMPVNYNIKNYSTIISEADENGAFNPDTAIEALTDAVCAFTNAKREVARGQIARLMPTTRRATIVRVHPSEWTLKASPKQLSNAQKFEEDIGFSSIV